MKDIRTPGDPGQNLESSRILHSRPAPLIKPERAQIASSLVASLRRTEELARLLMVTPETPSDVGPPLALRSDGELLVNTSFLPAEALEGRSLWVGVPVPHELLNDAWAALDGAALEVVGRVLGRMAGEAEEPSDEDRQGENLEEGNTQTDE